MRQLIEYGGYWRTSDKAWVTLERIQFVSACNPPTDPGHVLLTHRFLHHSPLIMVDYPSEISLRQIYGSYSCNGGFLSYITKTFTPDIQVHYI